MFAETEHLAQLIDSKHRCLIELRELGRQQSTLIGAGEVSELLRMFASKQRLIDQLQQFERALDVYRGQDPDSRTWRTNADRQRCAQVVAQSQALLDEILEREKRNEAELMHKRDEAAARLSNLHLTRDAHHAYAQAEQTGMSAFDLTS